MSAISRNVLVMVAVGALTAGSVLMAGASAEAKDGGGPARTTDSAVLAHAKKVAPLNAVANALGEQGRGRYADVYGNLSVDENGRTVTLYAIGAEQGRRIVAAAKAAHPEIDTSLVKVVVSPHTKKSLDAQVQQIIKATSASGAADLEVYSVAVNPDSSGITVSGRGDKLASITSRIQAGQASIAAAAPSGQGGTAQVEVVAGEPIHGSSWRWNDGVPQIGGDVLIGDAHLNGYAAQCTAGLATEDSNGRDYLVTAAHCFRNGSTVNGEGGSNPGQFTYSRGDWIGQVVNTNDHWDAQLIDTGGYNGSGSNSDEADQPDGKWYYVKGTAYSYNGQAVCQDGARSYYSGHGVPCNISVKNDDITYNLTWNDGSVHSVRGVQGYNSTWAVTEGDSGAAVFTVTNNTDREARGIVSALAGNQWMYWTEAPDILGGFGQHLNPHV
ncbi:hypothetical protein AB0K43_01725 [Kitasatospora sp. NPDC049258]|uniref:hypothetical protein n=1 Tax=Kitasatospora sp. NPDC049258 TaxID=3155394 RepID=UPI0034340CB6